MKPQFTKPITRTLIYSSIIILISFVCYFSNGPLTKNYVNEIESKTYDLLFIIRHNLKLNPELPKNILIVGIDAGSISKVGIPWPWPRQFHASLLDGLTSAKARFVIYDIIFDTISPLSLQTQDISENQLIAKSSFDAGKEDDDIFAKSIAQAMNVFLACEAEPISKTQYQAVLPIVPYLKALKNDIGFLGNSSVIYDQDNFVRKAKIISPEFYKDPALAGSTAFRVTQKYFKKRAEILSNEIVKIGQRKFPKEILINFYGPSETITTIPYWKALDLIYKGDTNIFKDKIIFIGRAKLKASIDPFKSVRAPDSFATPFCTLTPNFSGVEIQATIASNLLNNSYITRLNTFLFSLALLIISILTFFIVSWLRTRLTDCLLICLGLSALYIISAFLLLVFLRISIPPTFPVYSIILPMCFINFLDQYFIVDKARRRQARIFRQLVPTQVADEIEKMDQEQLALGGTKRIVTALFTDIQNFTRMCEKYAPEIIVNVLNQFFTEMVRIIHKYNGLVDKFIGDAIMAIWGSPKVLDNKLQATLAANCALDMKTELEKLNESWRELGLIEKLNIRIGVNISEAITGNVGSPQRIQFSAIGDGVNVASRLEGVNKVYGTTILLSESTAKYLDNSFYLREIDTVVVPGKDIPVAIYELVRAHEYNSGLVEKYTLALENYRNKNFDNAIKYWQECLKINPEDKPSKVMLDRTLKLTHSEIPNNWQPIWIVENK